MATTSRLTNVQRKTVDALCQLIYDTFPGMTFNPWKAVHDEHFVAGRKENWMFMPPPHLYEIEVYDHERKEFTRMNLRNYPQVHRAMALICHICHLGHADILKAVEALKQSENKAPKPR